MTVFILLFSFIIILTQLLYYRHTQFLIHTQTNIKQPIHIHLNLRELNWWTIIATYFPYTTTHLFLFINMRMFVHKLWQEFYEQTLKNKKLKMYFVQAHWHTYKTWRTKHDFSFSYYRFSCSSSITHSIYVNY